MVLLLMKKRTLFSKIKAVRAHEVKLVSWASQLSLQALGSSMQEAFRHASDAAALVVLVPLPLVDEAAAEAAVACFDTKLEPAEDAEGFS